MESVKGLEKPLLIGGFCVVRLLVPATKAAPGRTLPILGLTPSLRERVVSRVAATRENGSRKHQSATS